MIKKIVYALTGLLLLGLLSGCERLTELALSEQQINQYLLQSIDYQKNLNVSGVVNADITLNNMQAKIGRQEPNKVTLSADANIKVKSIFGDHDAVMSVTLKALPFFDQPNGAIYLKEMELVDYRVQPVSAESTLKLLTPYLSQSLTSYFDSKPVYIIDPSKGEAEKLAREFAKGLEVKPGKIVIPFIE